MGDPLISYDLDGSKIFIPLSHDLPFIRSCFPHYSSNIGRVAEEANKKYPDFRLIDIGANVGDTVAILRSKAHFPILCIDGDPYFFSILSRNGKNFTDVDLVKSFVGDVTGHFSGRIDVVGGTGHLVVDQHSNQELETKKLEDILVENPRFAKAKMIKVDTDGFDCKILKSELPLLKELKPILFFEYDPYFFKKFKDDGFKIFHDLREIGYKAALVFENTGEYLIHMNLDDDLTLEDIHQFYSGWSGRRYCDICVFHEVDLDIFMRARLNEIEFFKNTRSDENSL